MSLTDAQARDLWVAAPLQQVRPSERTRLLPHATWHVVGRGCALASVVDVPSVFLVRTGTIRLGMPAVPALTTGFARRDSLVGPLVLDRTAGEPCAVVHDRATVVAFPRAALEALAADWPAIHHLLTWQIVTHARRVEQLAGRLARRHAAERVARTLLELAAEHGLADLDGRLIPFRLSQRDLASLTGLSRETVNSAVSGLRDRGVVATAGGRLRVGAALASPA